MNERMVWATSVIANPEMASKTDCLTDYDQMFFCYHQFRGEPQAGVRWILCLYWDLQAEQSPARAKGQNQKSNRPGNNCSKWARVRQSEVKTARKGSGHRHKASESRCVFIDKIVRTSAWQQQCAPCWCLCTHLTRLWLSVEHEEGIWRWWQRSNWVGLHMNAATYKLLMGARYSRLHNNEGSQQERNTSYIISN